MDDAGLLAAVRGGDTVAARAALEQLYDRHAEAVMAWIRSSGIDGHTAEDILQDVFVAVARWSGDFVGTSARGWMLTIAANRISDVRRSAARRDQRERRAAEPETWIEPGPAVEVQDTIERHVRGLPAGHRRALFLRVQEGLSFAEIAAVLGVSVRTAKYWVESALARVRDGGRDA